MRRKAWGRRPAAAPFPARTAPASRSRPRTCRRASTDHRPLAVVRLDRDVQAVGVSNQRQQVVLADRLGDDLEHTGQVGMVAMTRATTVAISFVVMPE